MNSAETDQASAILYLSRMLANGSLPHALLFSGIEGVGKSTIAEKLAMALNCDSAKSQQPEHGVHPNHLLYCNTCRACKKIMAESHPDIIRLQPDGRFIKIAQVRELIDRLSVKPVEAVKRVVIIRSAETMNVEAANALLKILEEPPVSTMFILITKQPSDILPTILSRCRQIGFTPVLKGTISSVLQQDYTVEKIQAETYAYLSGGSPEKAIGYAENENWKRKRNWLLETFSRLKNGSTVFGLVFVEKIMIKKEEVPELLELLLTYVRDLIIFKFSQEKIINRDFTELISEVSGKYSVKSLLSIADHIQKAATEIKSNVSLRLSLEVMVLKIIRE